MTDKQTFGWNKRFKIGDKVKMLSAKEGNTHGNAGIPSLTEGNVGIIQDITEQHADGSYRMSITWEDSIPGTYWWYWENMLGLIETKKEKVDFLSITRQIVAG